MLLPSYPSGIVYDLFEFICAHLKVPCVAVLRQLCQFRTCMCDSACAEQRAGGHPRLLLLARGANVGRLQQHRCRVAREEQAGPRELNRACVPIIGLADSELLLTDVSLLVALMQGVRGQAQLCAR